LSQLHQISTYFNNFGHKDGKEDEIMCVLHNSVLMQLGEVENECTSHKFIIFANFVPKIIKVRGKLTKF